MASRILVADDSLTIQKVISITLSNEDYVLFEARSEEELIETLNTNKFDLVLLDYKLSETREGPELVEMVKNSNSKAPILLMVGTFDSLSETQLKELGVQDHIVKPFESSLFIEKCRTLIGDNSEEVKEFSSEEDLTESFEDTSEYEEVL